MVDAGREVMVEGCGSGGCSGIVVSGKMFERFRCFWRSSHHAVCWMIESGVLVCLGSRRRRGLKGGEIVGTRAQEVILKFCPSDIV